MIKAMTVAVSYLADIIVASNLSGDDSMARKLKLLLDDVEYECTVDKLDRGKLYGHKEVSVRATDHTPLTKAYLDDWGSVLIHSTGMGYIDEGWQWCDRSSLEPVDNLGQPIEQFPSTFDGPVTLQQKATLDDFFMHEVDSVYILRGQRIPELIEILSQMEGMFVFPFNFPAGHFPKSAFVNRADDALFLMVAEPTEATFLDRPQRFEIEDMDDEDELDFSMM